MTRAVLSSFVISMFRQRNKNQTDSHNLFQNGGTVQGVATYADGPSRIPRPAIGTFVLVKFNIMATIGSLYDHFKNILKLTLGSFRVRC